MSVNIDIRGEGGSPTRTTSRMSVYFTDTGTTTTAAPAALTLRPCEETEPAPLFSACAGPLRIRSRALHGLFGRI